jgi:hypothetical protein
MARVFIHVGGHKTGTSYLQAMFDQNRDLLAQHGIYYPHIGPNNAHHALAAHWINIGDIPDSFYGEAGAMGLWTALTKRYADAPGTLFLSAENFTRIRPERIDMAELAGLLSAFEDVRVVYTMRRQTDTVQSLWMQIAKTRRAAVLRGYVETALEHRRGGGIPIDYSSVYTHLREGFTPEQIYLIDYSAMKRAPGGIVGTFLRLLGSDLEASDLTLLRSTEEANVSPDPIALFMACEVLGQTAAPPAHLVKTITRAVRAPGAPPATLLTRAEYQKVRSRFAGANTKLVEQVQQTQPGFNFDEGEMPEDLFYRDDLTVAHWTKVAAALHTERPVPEWVQSKQLLRRLLKL